MCWRILFWRQIIFKPSPHEFLKGLIFNENSNSMENLTYEIFVRRGFKCDRGQRKGADVIYYDNLGYDSYAHLLDPTDKKAKQKFDKTLSEIKGYMEKALTHSLKRLLKNATATADINALILRTQAATTKSDLDGIVEDGIKKFNQYGVNLS